MKQTIVKFIKQLAKALGLLLALMLIYLFFLVRDMKKVDDFCGEMVPGLDVSRIPLIAQKYDVGFKRIQAPDAVKNRALGIKAEDAENTWFFAVASLMTMGEHACGVYHDYRVVLSAKSMR